MEPNSPWVLLGNLIKVFSLLDEPDLSTEGNTTIEYKAIDYRGVSSSVTRDVEVIKTPPVISIAYTDLDNNLSDSLQITLD